MSIEAGFTDMRVFKARYFSDVLRIEGIDLRGCEVSVNYRDTDNTEDLPAFTVADLVERTDSVARIMISMESNQTAELKESAEYFFDLNVSLGGKPVTIVKGQIVVERVGT